MNWKCNIEDMRARELGWGSEKWVTSQEIMVVALLSGCKWPEDSFRNNKWWSHYFAIAEVFSRFTSLWMLRMASVSSCWSLISTISRKSVSNYLYFFIFFYTWLIEEGILIFDRLICKFLAKNKGNKINAYRNFTIKNEDRPRWKQMWHWRA